MFGGGDQDRTDYLLTASQALYQVSYAPIYGAPSRNCTDDLHLTMVLLYSLSYRGMFVYYNRNLLFANCLKY